MPAKPKGETRGWSIWRALIGQQSKQDAEMDAILNETEQQTLDVKQATNDLKRIVRRRTRKITKPEANGKPARED
jgi:hypothetical protein